MDFPRFKVSEIAVMDHAVLRFCERVYGLVDPLPWQKRDAKHVLLKSMRPTGYYKLHPKTKKVQHLFVVEVEGSKCGRVYAFIQENGDWRVDEPWFVRTVMTDAEWTARKGYLKYDDLKGGDARQ
jgi:hypothetical protein